MKGPNYDYAIECLKKGGIVERSLEIDADSVAKRVFSYLESDISFISNTDSQSPRQNGSPTASTNSPSQNGMPAFAEHHPPASTSLGANRLMMATVPAVHGG